MVFTRLIFKRPLLKKETVNKKLQIINSLPSGFTLVEMLIVLVIFSFILGMFSFIITSVIKTSYLNDARLAVRQNLQFSTDIISRTIRDSKAESIQSLMAPGGECSFAGVRAVRQDKELCFLIESNPPQFYKFSLEMQNLNIGGQVIHRGRIFLYKYFSAEDLRQNKNIQSLKVLTYRDVDIDVANSQITYDFKKATNSTKATVFVTISLEADSSYKLGRDAQGNIVPAVQNIRRKIGVLVD